MTLCALCSLECGRDPLTQGDRKFCCAGCLNVYAILEESGVIAAGQDFRETEVYRQSLKLGLISNPQRVTADAEIPPTAETREILLQLSGMCLRRACSITQVQEAHHTVPVLSSTATLAFGRISTAAAMVLSSLSVIGNSLRLGRRLR